MYLGRTLPPDEFMAHWRTLKDHVRFPGDFSGSARFREELRHLPRDEAMLKAVAAAQQSIFQSAGVFFAATFGVYLVCDIYIVRGMCALLARGAIISEIVIIVLLSPVLCVCESFIAKTTPSWRLKT